MEELYKELKKEKRTIFILAVAVFLLLQGMERPVWGWVEPSAAPPGGDIPAPVFGSSTAGQIKNSALTISGDLTIRKNLYLSGGYLDFGDNAKTIRASGTQGFIAIGTSAANFFDFFVSGAYAGKLAVGSPAATNPPTNLYVAGTGYFNGSAVIGGDFTMGPRANVCSGIIYSYTSGSGTTPCPVKHYLVAVMDTSNNLVNPGSLPTSGKFICCKNDDP